MYQMLKSNGLDDDHILLVSEDDIARHSMNPTPGRILPPEGEGNLYENVIVDYKLSEVGLSGLLETLTTGTSFRPGVYGQACSSIGRAGVLRKGRSGSTRRFTLSKWLTFSRH